MNKQAIIRALEFLRVLDEKGNLSLTNLALVAAVTKLLLTPQLATADLLTFAAGLASYQFKRWMAPDAGTDESAELKNAIESLQTKVSALQVGNQLKR